MKKLLLLAVLVLVIVGIATIGEKPEAPVGQGGEPVRLCFYKETKTDRGLYDRAWLFMHLNGEQVTGEFRHLPAEKDSKIGTFEGTVSAVDKMSMSRTANVWWNAMAEGTTVQEELKITFGEGDAQAFFGEMVDRGDGAYVYKDPNNLTSGPTMTDVACGDLDDRIIVEKYVRENIKTLAPETPVLGGTLYATTIHIDPSAKTGEVAYEDGHISGRATFTYARNGEAVTISNMQKSE